MCIRVLVFLAYFATAAAAQVELVSNNYFPAELEFPELRNVVSEKTVDDSARLSGVGNGILLLDVGFEKYSERTYSTDNNGRISIEIATLKDWRAAFSLLTLLRSSIIQDGPPGNAFVSNKDGIGFAQSKYWINIQGKDISENLLRRIAISVSNRIGPHQNKPPALISHFPALGYDASSLKYIIGPISFESYSSVVANGQLKYSPIMEIAQAGYSLDGHEGTLTLIGFPTSQAAEDYFSGLAEWKSAEKNTSETYAKKVGPLLGFLDGNFDPTAADEIMNSIRYAYSVRWIYEKGNNATTVWGVPASILGTVVRSLLFVALLCVASVLAGVFFAGIRMMVRRHASKNPDQMDKDGNTYLRIR